jgi:tetratricopeptide (TPR) repeat protein
MLPLLMVLLARPVAAPADTVPLYTDLGAHHQAVSTRSATAQAYFDQGLRLTYAFNHGEAVRAFEEAARLDPRCAMCWWGVALALGPHVNGGMDAAGATRAWNALGKAQTAAPYATPREQAYIRALGARYAANPPADRAPLDSAYARAMAGLVKQYPGDLDAATLYAEALMDLAPWNYWNADGTPRPGTTILVAELERVMAAAPDHPGACHYYIHAVEAVDPVKAVPCAERLAALMPGAGHMVHMPGHIYIRVGRYNDAIKANEHAVHADEAYIGRERPQGLYPVGYYPHNYHFLAFAATMAGRSALAIESARKLRETTPVEVARQVPPVEPYVPYIFLTLVSFGRWDEMLQEPVPPQDLTYSYGMAQYARGVAFAATGRMDEARQALDSLRVAATTSNAAYVAAGWTSPRGVLDIATKALEGEIALRSGRYDDAIRYFADAAAREDALQYIEPPDWYYPVRHSLGSAYLGAGKPADAERVYREDLKRFPDNGWSLIGLEQALRAQGKSAQADEAARALTAAWAEGDVKLSASRY